MLGAQADLLFKLTDERFFRSLVFLYTPLGKLPARLALATCPEQPAGTVRKDDADIGAEALRVDQSTCDSRFTHAHVPSVP